MYICTPNNEERFTKSKLVKGRTIREISSAGSEHLPYKQGVTGSNPVSPTKRKAFQETERLFCVYGGLNIIRIKSGSSQKLGIKSKAFGVMPF
jgi:hypothetical protein